MEMNNGKFFNLLINILLITIKAILEYRIYCDLNLIKFKVAKLIMIKIIIVNPWQLLT